nr:beta-1,3-glucan-binding protein-like [Leptinotarsa decemlineata]
MFLLLILFSSVIVEAQYEVPEALVEPLSPKGFRVSIPDEEGIKLFAFHGKINEEMIGREAGTFSRDILKPKNGRWTFVDTATKLKVGDIIYYWTYVEYSTDGSNKLGFPKDDQMFTVTELIPQTTSTTSTRPVQTMFTTTIRPVQTTSQKVPLPTPQQPSGDTCEPSVTTFNGGKSTCKNKLIFNDAFTTEVRKKFWTVQQRFAGAPDYEFVIYANRSETLFIRNRILRIKPELTDDVFGPESVYKSYDFGENCTAIPGSQDCQIRPDAGFILPPVISSQINTRGKFSFKYGKIEIRAKLPQGDWIYPELYLNSVNEEYGSGYDSGQIRVAFTEGNEGSDNVLRGGVILGSSTSARSFGMNSIEKSKRWSNEFHRFAVTWKPDNIVLSVDGKVYGSIYPPTGGFSSLGQELSNKNSERWKTGSVLAPFDKEMFITLGVGVGGFNIEDRTDGSKPWKNGERLSMKKFYKAAPNWKTTWNDNSLMSIDHVKVWAL